MTRRLFSSVPLFGRFRQGAGAHERADKIELHAFVAAFNTWRDEHPKAQDHYQKLDVGDVRRWRETEKCWKELTDMMRQAGYS